MPRVKPEERRRAKRPKTKSGCKTCKIRRVKCDETKPACRRCSSTGRKCDGYDTSSLAFPSLTTKTVSHWHGLASCQEWRAFQFFREFTTPQLSGSVDCDLWSYILPRAASEDIGLRHAVIALGTIHEYFVNTGDPERVKDDFALQQYNLAIRQYIDQLTRDRPESVTNYVVACIIFICIELLQGHYQSAISLINNSVQLFYDEAVHGSDESTWPLETIEMVLSRLQIQVVGLVGPSAMTKISIPSFRKIGISLVPDSFHSIQQAKQYLEYYYHRYNLARRTSAACDHDLALYVSIFARWVTAFETLVVALGPRLSKEDARAIKLLQIQQLVIAVPLQMYAKQLYHEDSVPMWDDYPVECERMLELAESVLEGDATTALESPGRPRFHFTLDLHVVGPLYDLASLSREPLRRRRAIALLRKYPRREGLWDSLLAARIVERRMEIEEGAVPDVRSAADVPSWARLSSATPTLTAGERHMIITFKRQRSAACNGSRVAFNEVLKW